MKISVCLIARNEEEVIGRCLESISVFADEIIVVDTGSIDKTKKIAGGFTEKIFDFEWINDFFTVFPLCNVVGIDPHEIISARF